jgi:hypothetical protein
LQNARNLGNDNATKTSTMQQKHKNFNNVLFLLIVTTTIKIKQTSWHEKRVKRVGEGRSHWKPGKKNSHAKESSP